MGNRLQKDVLASNILNFELPLYYAFFRSHIFNQWYFTATLLEGLCPILTKCTTYHTIKSEHGSSSLIMVLPTSILINDFTADPSPVFKRG